MKTRYLALGAATVLAAASLTGCAVRFGPMATDSPEIGDVTAVVLDTAGDLTISEGEPSLTIHAPEAVLDVLTTRVTDGVLVLGRTPGPLPFTFGSADLRYELTVPSLDAIEVNGAGDIDSTVSSDELRIEINGAGDVTVDGIDATTVSVSISGAGDIDLAGTAESLSIAIDGTGDVDADDLEVVDAVVEIGGAGGADLHVTGTLRAEVSGVGTIRHRGGADVEADVSGLGEVIEED